ncbi:MAG TPA: hypothetical protein VLB49_14590 [Gemmatimonadales bacterium]|nr:hypothetical protein [Gemmatimonadales bacterium]
MKTFPRRSSQVVGLVVVLWALAGCGGGSQEPITLRSLAVTGGDQQTACLHDTLADSLEVTLTGSDNRPFGGVPVAWQVTSGAATLSRAVDTTDAMGKSRVQLSLGLALTSVAVTATVTQLPPATFSAAAAITPYALGQTATGALTPSDCGGDQFPFFDLYAVTITSPQGFTASLTSATFDAVMEIADDTPFPVASNDDSGDGSGGTNSFLRMIAAGGTYFFAASSYSAGETGAYTLATAAGPVEVDGCPVDVWVTRGIATNQEIKTTDCVDASGPYYYDAYVMFLAAGQTLTITESSTAFDAELFLCIDICFVSDDNSGGGTNARITHQAPLGQNQVLFIVPATKGIGETGAYTLTIAPPPAATTPRLPLLGTDRLAVPLGVSKSRIDRLRSWHRISQ